MTGVEVAAAAAAPGAPSAAIGCRCFATPRYARRWRASSRRCATASPRIDAPQVHLLGHSLGGLVILRCLERYPMAQPGRVVFLGTPAAGSRAARRLGAVGPGTAAARRRERRGAAGRARRALGHRARARASSPAPCRSGLGRFAAKVRRRQRRHGRGFRDPVAGATASWRCRRRTRACCCRRGSRARRGVFSNMEVSDDKSAAALRGRWLRAHLLRAGHRRAACCCCIRWADSCWCRALRATRRSPTCSTIWAGSLRSATDVQSVLARGRDPRADAERSRWCADRELRAAARRVQRDCLAAAPGLDLGRSAAASSR